MSRKVFQEAELKLSLILDKIIFLLYFFSLCVPNLIFSGAKFVDQLHVMKWTVLLVPFFMILFIIGFHLFYHGKNISFKIDIFAVFLSLIIFFCASQYFFVKISSEAGFFQELFCFVFFLLFYVVTSEYFSKNYLNHILWLSNINAVINIIFAELQTRGLYDLEFLKNTPYEFLMPMKNFIWRGFIGEAVNYIGNVGQHNMFGLWLAVCTVNAAYLFLINIKKQKFLQAFVALCFIYANIFGLLSSNSRSGLLSMSAGLLITGLIFVLRLEKIYKKYLAVIIIIFLTAAAGLIFTNSQGINRMLGKLSDVEQFKTVAGRTGLWARSFDMLKLYPMGVGIGQYKWHFLEAPRERFKADPDERFRYTFWAHNEFIQFFCEAGIIGGIMLMILMIFWCYKFMNLLSTRQEISFQTVWSCGIIFVFLCNALWTRPFHRIEILTWLSLAFAVGNREILRKYIFDVKILKPFGLIFICSSLFGLVYLSGGIYGNLLLKKAFNTDINEPQKKAELFADASKYPFVKEKALRNFALFYLDLGEKINDLKLCEKAFNLLWESLCREPDPNYFRKILVWAQHFQYENIMREIVSYYKPGTYRLEKVKAKDLQGNSTDITIVRDEENSVR